MEKLIKYWNQNRWKILITAIIIVFVIALIYTINSVLKNVQEPVIRPQATVPDLSKPTESVITGEEITEEEAEENSNLIKQFVEYCNQKDYQNAYDLLSQDCKEQIFRDLNSFASDYVDEIFDTEKTYTLELWFTSTGGYTYRVLYINDNILSSGTVDTTNNKEDYITVVEENEGQYKLNISNFIYKDTINKTQSISNIDITINSVNKYRSYETYSITVKNSTDKTILLCPGTNGNDICLMDTNDVEYNSIINEVPMVNLEIAPGAQKTMIIRFYKMYNLYRTIDRIAFKNIILDKDSYNENPENAQTTALTIEI